MKEIGIGLLGLGNVGTSVFNIIREHQEEIVYKTGCNLSIIKILVRDIKKDRGIDIEPGVLTNKRDSILCDPTIDIVIEVAGGGVDAANEMIRTALNNKKTCHHCQ